MDGEWSEMTDVIRIEIAFPSWSRCPEQERRLAVERAEKWIKEEAIKINAGWSVRRIEV